MSTGTAISRAPAASSEMQREDLRAHPSEAQRERDGFLSLDEVMRDADTLFEEMAGPNGRVPGRGVGGR